MKSLPSSTQGRRENHLCGARIHCRRRALLHRRRTSTAHAILCSPAAVPWGSGNLSRVRFLTFRNTMRSDAVSLFYYLLREALHVSITCIIGVLYPAALIRLDPSPAICIAVSGGPSGYVLTSGCWLGYLAIQRHIVLHSMGGHRPNSTQLPCTTGER